MKEYYDQQPISIGSEERRRAVTERYLFPNRRNGDAENLQRNSLFSTRGDNNTLLSQNTSDDDKRDYNMSYRQVGTSNY